jgi:thiamine-phosphate pyrophosphorylase
MTSRSPGLSESPSFHRVLQRCRQLAAASDSEQFWIGCLLLSLLRDESLAAAVLSSLKLDLDFLRSGALGTDVAGLCSGADHAVPAQTDAAGVADSDEAFDPEFLRRIIDRAMLLGRKDPAAEGVTSCHLLFASAQTSEVMQRLMKLRGCSEHELQGALGLSHQAEVLPVPPEAELHFATDIFAPGPKLAVQTSAEPVIPDAGSIPGARKKAASAIAVQESASTSWRVVDANLNRGREGLRVLEDFVRFASDHSGLTRQVKQMRHRLVAAEQLLESQFRNEQSLTTDQRDTEGDVGTAITVDGEQHRGSLRELVRANCRRLQEALRSLEEFGKLLSTRFAADMKQLRYEAYTLEKDLMALSSSQLTPAADRDVRLRQSRLYVLITEESCRLPWKQVVESVLAAGAHVLQLREKALADRDLLRRAQWFSDACRESGALCVINDRPDITRAADGDGVHVGQEELPCEFARELIGPGRLVGLSTHSPQQAQDAIRAGADYLGVGPVFPSQTKSFAEFPGLLYVQEAARTVTIPWFAIGGVTLSNLSELLAAGATRVAVTSAIAMSDNPGAVVTEFLSQLNTTGHKGKLASS